MAWGRGLLQLWLWLWLQPWHGGDHVLWKVVAVRGDTKMGKITWWGCGVRGKSHRPRSMGEDAPRRGESLGVIVMWQRNCCGRLWPWLGARAGAWAGAAATANPCVLCPGMEMKPESQHWISGGRWQGNCHAGSRQDKQGAGAGGRLPVPPPPSHFLCYLTPYCCFPIAVVGDGTNLRDPPLQKKN